MSVEGGFMRRYTISAATAFGVLTLLGGCRREMIPDPPAAVSKNAKPTAPDLVAYLNHNAQLVQSIKSTQLEIQAKQGNDSIGLQGTLFCQKPRDFRLRANVAGQPAVDIGSNNEEFWFWISQAKDDDGVARVHYCSYADMAGGKARMPFPFQPDMIVAALGMGDYDPQKEYTIREDAKTWSLIEKATSAQGQPVQKVTQFNKTTVGPNKPQIIAYYLLDDKGNEVCRASVLDVQTITVGGQPAVIPKHVKLVWRTQQIEMSMRLFDTEVNKIDGTSAAKLFSRAGLSIPASNLARGPDAPSGVSQDMSIRRARLDAPVK
jgi:hypothetical protein